ncbi:permease family-domain-containing protein [Zychaea mexicana]|uniref:permease family-domain-containing protein n=1 Tax=Zychaea mexicana TaxID=64656 RepID=UPI0022FF2B9A|nr:permease family-domain-containing protein [Zychaea mexicana]KAI9493448.1 permease family-domain-containing protein [Zychaea mexicana]
MPHIPFLRRRTNTSPFYGPNDPIPVFLAIVMGIQHFLSVIGGVITPTILISGSGSNALNLDQDLRQYMISASLIVSGLMSLIQIVRFRVPKTRYYIGAGLLQITGVSFANLPAAQAMVSNMYTNGTVNPLPCPDAFGAILGTQMVCALLTIAISFLPPRIIRKLFPKIVTGVVLLVIGSSLLTSAMQNWAGGSGPCMSRPESGDFALCPTVYAPNAQKWGSPVNFALGASVFFTIIVLELVGSVFLKNISVVVGLLFGCIIAAGIGMFDSSDIAAAPAATFLWVKTFKLSIYGPGVIPFLFVYLDMTIECLGDLTAACDVSGMAITGKTFESRCQGGLLADGLSGIFSGLATSMGVVTFSQNNGVIAVTRCANRYAGVICASLLIIFGIFSKISAAFLAIPSPLIGGMTVFLFASVATSGIRILGYLDWTRRDRVIVAASLALALGVSVVPDWFTYVMPKVENSALQGFYDAITTVVSTGYIMGGILSVLLNLILPYEAAAEKSDDNESSKNSIGGVDRVFRDEEAGTFYNDKHFSSAVGNTKENA